MDQTQNNQIQINREKNSSVGANLNKLTKAMNTSIKTSCLEDKKVDLALLLSQLDGDKIVLIQMMDIFLDEYNSHQETIKIAIENQNSEALSKAAHKFKSLLSHFCNEGFKLANELEINSKFTAENNIIFEYNKFNLLYKQLALITDQVVLELTLYKQKFEKAL